MREGRWPAMPIYEFRCNDCRKKFSLVKPIKDYSDAAKCPKCGKRKGVERVWSQVYAVTSKKS
jgi:putative FmdB family regulatory protein